MIPDEKKMDSKKEPGFEPITDDPENQKSEISESSGDDPLANESYPDRSDHSRDFPSDSENLVDSSTAKELDEARGKIAELEKQYLLTRAEAENIRKRADVEISNARKFALERFARELLSVKDSLDLARSVDLTPDAVYKSVVGKVVEGIDLTIKQLESVFARFQIEEVNPDLGDKLDPELHQAMSIEETIEFEPTQICRVIQKGYLLHNRLLRPAMVIVAKTPEDS
jgi:molecular chaperone GrpE